jgi:diguanylate cyclase (GGDEF)-like protein
MNSLSAKIREAITQEFDRAEHLRKEAFEDSLTGQFNRRGFEQSVSAKLEDSGAIHSGALAFASLAGLEEINRQFGLARGNEILRCLADAMAAPAAHGSAIVGRWQGPTLAAFIPNVASQPAHDWADGLCQSFIAGLGAQGLPEGVVLSIGATHFSEDTVTLARLAQAAESALGDAVKKGGAVFAPLQSETRESGWDLKKEIQSAIEANRITLLGQKVLSIAGTEVLQVELLCSLSGSDGRAIPAGTFVPVASQHGLLAALDIRVVEHAFAALERVGSLPWSVSVNVSIQSICDDAFRASLRKLFIQYKQFAWRLVVEITGYAASRSPEQARIFAAELRATGVRIALDNFDIDRNSMAIVNDLRPSYVKLAPSFTQEITAREDLRFLVSAMVRMLRPLDIPLIAQGVEDAGTIPVLAELGLAGYQGYAGGRPEPLNEG